MKLVSVIIPVYNTEKYLEKCINGFINQTYSNLEIILIDDGSTDNSPLLCDRFKYIDHRIKVIHKKNGGLSEARNVGIEASTGELITFFDSDDYVDQNYIEYLYYLKNKFQTQISTCYYNIVSENGTILSRKKENVEKLLEKEEVLEKMLKDDDITVSACFKLYNKSLFRNIKFPVGKLCEDNGTTYKIIDSSITKIAYGSLAYGYYVMRKGSIMRSEFNIKKLDMIEMTEQMCNYLSLKYPSLNILIKRRRIYARFNVLCQLNYDNEKDKFFIDSLSKYILGNKYFILSNIKIPKRDKIGCILLMINKKLFFFIWNMYKEYKYGN